MNGWADFALTEGIARFAEMIMKVPVFAEYADRGGSERQWMYKVITSNTARGVAHTARRVLGGRPSIYEWEDGLRQLTVPTLVLAGAYDETLLQDRCLFRSHHSGCGVHGGPGRWPFREPRSAKRVQRGDSGLFEQD